jgi:hypothetical protein
MPTVTSLTTTYAGELAGEILAPALVELETLKHVTVKQNVPYKTVVRTIVDDVTFAAGTCDFTPTGTITLAERILTLEEFQVQRQICKKDFFTDWSTKDVMSGRVNAEIQAAILERLTSGIAANMENNVIWKGVNGTTGQFDGFGTIIDADANNDINFVASPVALTSSNIIAKIDALIAACPVAVKAATEKPVIYMNYATWELFMQAQIAAGNGWYANLGPAMAGQKYMGLYDIAVCPGIAANTMYMARKSNLWFGTWLTNDMNEVFILDMKDKDGSQNVRYGATFYAGAQIGLTSEIAAYGPGLS